MWSLIARFLPSLAGGAMNYVAIGLGVALLASWAASGVMFRYFDGKLTAANERAEKAQKDLGKEEQSRQGFQAAAKSCSDSVDAMKVAGEKKEAEYQASRAKSAQKTADAESIISMLLSAPRPVGLDECQATFKELDDEIDDRHPRV